MPLEPLLGRGFPKLLQNKLVYKGRDGLAYRDITGSVASKDRPEKGLSTAQTRSF